MNLAQAELLTNALMNQYGLIARGWRFEWDGAKARFGCCYHGSKRITLSKPLTEVGRDEEVEDTIRHEIAHALTGPQHGHDLAWKLKAIEVGAKPRACSSTKVSLETDWKGICVDCGYTYNYHRAPKYAHRPYAVQHHTLCRHKKGKGHIKFTYKGEPVGWAKLQQFNDGMANLGIKATVLEAQAAEKQAKPMATDLSQADINSMWERLNKLERKL